MRCEYLVMLCLSATVHAGSPAAAETPAAAHIHQPRVLIVAHRGDSRHAPENTLPAFRSAVRAGADLVELDYYHSADGIPVVFHDKTLDRTTDARQCWGRAKIEVSSRSLKDLQSLDAGTWFGPEFSGTRIPTLEEAIDAIQTGSRTLVERKAGDAATCIALLRRKQLLGHVVVQAFDWDFLADCHRLAPELSLGALGGDQLSAARLEQIQRCGASVVGWNHKHLDAPSIKAIHARGMNVWAYTVNDVPRVKQLIADGIDGIITDDPASLLPLVR